MDLSLLKDLIFFNVKKINGPQLYHGLPYKLRYLIKKIKYGKQAKQDKLLSRYDKNHTQ